jgi:NAD-dependent dihydropyrimidine dehydrogenase PreA subunit
LINTFLYWTEEAGLKIVLYALLIGLALRVLFFIGRLLYAGWSSRHRNGLLSTPLNLLRALLPYHGHFLKAPFYTGVRYVFHACLLIVPIWYSGHIAMWEESSLEWYWTPISDETADLMTLAVIGIGVYFMLRRLIAPETRRRSSATDFLIIALTILPFLTGYLYTHGTLDHIEFFSSYLWYFHVISGEAMLVMMIVLYCVTRMNEAKCVGCAACEINCPTGTLESLTQDQIGERTFFYSHYQCICCASCVDTCPEGAVELRHKLAIGYFFNLFTKRVIRTVPLARCEQCGVYYAPVPQIASLAEKMEHSEADTQRIKLCQRCKKIASARRVIHPVPALGGAMEKAAGPSEIEKTGCPPINVILNGRAALAPHENDEQKA